MSEPAVGFRRLPLRKVIGGAFTLPWRHRADFMGPLALPLIAVIACTFAWRRHDFEDLDASLIALMLANGLAVSWLAIGVHRLVLLEGVQAGTRIDAQNLRRFGVYLTACVAMWVLFTVVAMIATGGLITVLQGKYVSEGPDVVLHPSWLDTPIAVEWVAYFAAALGLWAMAKLCLVLPAIAVDKKLDFGGAWRASRGNGWRLALVFVVLPWCLSELTFVFVRDGASMVESGVFAVLTAPLVVVEVVALSLSYWELTSPAPPPTPPPA